MAKTIGITYEKGGVGKTTTAVNVSAILASNGYRVLLVDADPQSYATSYYDLYSEAHPSLYDVMSRRLPVKEAIRETSVLNLHLLPARYELEAVETDLAALSFGQEFVLREALEPIADDYDFIIIDCPPAGVRMKTNVLTAANYLILPTIPDDYAVQGLMQISQRIGLLRRYANPHIEVLGVLITMDEQTANKKAYKEALREQPLFPCFNQTIRKNTTLSEAINSHKPICQYRRHALGSKDYHAFTMELLEVIKNVENQS